MDVAAQQALAQGNLPSAYYVVSPLEPRLPGAPTNENPTPETDRAEGGRSELSTEAPEASHPHGRLQLRKRRCQIDPHALMASHRARITSLLSEHLSSSSYIRELSDMSATALGPAASVSDPAGESSNSYEAGQQRLQHCVATLETMDEFQMQFLFRLHVMLQTSAKVAEEQNCLFFGGLLHGVEKLSPSSLSSREPFVTAGTARPVERSQFHALYTDLLPVIEACSAEGRDIHGTTPKLSAQQHKAAICAVLAKHLQK